MVKISKIFAYFIFFILALIYFLPKLNLYYYLENELQNYKVILTEKAKEDTGFSLKLKEADIFYDSIEVAKVENINLKIFVLHNTMQVKNVKLSNLTSSFMPEDIKQIDIRYSIINPLNIVAHINGGFGVANINFNVLDKNVSVDLTPSKLMLQRYQNTLRNFTKTGDKEYKYVKTF